LKAKLTPLGVPCILRHHDDYRGQEHPEEAMYRDLVGFFAEQLRRRPPISETGSQSSPP
jgi:hypothetical protein